MILLKKLIRFYRRFRRDLSYLRHLPQRSVQRMRESRFTLPLQQPIKTFHSDIVFDSIEELRTKLQLNKIQYEKGQHTIYISECVDIRKLNSELLEAYPHPFGLKIILSQEMSPDNTPYYTSNKLAQSTTHISKWAIGSVREKMIAGNLLSMYGVVPRSYDIVKLRSGDLIIFGMIVQHIDGDIVTGDPGFRFIEHLGRVLNGAGITILGSWSHKDFQPPTFGNNIVANSSGSYYVDIQKFRISSHDNLRQDLTHAIQNLTHFGDSRLFRPERYAYQSVPDMGIQGKRDSLSRISNIQTFLERNDVELRDCSILDVGCNLGIFIICALYSGAQWCVGLDTPEITQVARRFIFERGFSRFDLIGCDLRERSIAHLLPSLYYDLVLYMSIEKHIGFPIWLNELTFRYLLYEGHAGESVTAISEKVQKWNPGIEIIDSEFAQDGDSLSRPMLLCRLASS